MAPCPALRTRSVSEGILSNVCPGSSKSDRSLSRRQPFCGHFRGLSVIQRDFAGYEMAFGTVGTLLASMNNRDLIESSCAVRPKLLAFHQPGL